MDSLLTTAVILSSGRLFPRRGRPAPPNALMRVGTLSLFQRTLLTLQRGGISRFVVLSGDETDILKRQADADAAGKPEICWLPIREFSPEDPRTWESISDMVAGPYLAAATDAVFAPGLVTRLRTAGTGSTPVIVMDEADAQARTPIALRTALNGEGEEEGTVMVEAVIEPMPAVGLVSLPETFTRSGWADEHDRSFSLLASLERALRRGQARVLPVEPDWYQELDADMPSARAQAEWILLKDRLDRFVGRHFHRPCPWWLSRTLRQIVHLLR